jgi:small-conductance mechanosensitive channel
MLLGVAAADLGVSWIADWLHGLLDGWAPFVLVFVFIAAALVLERFVLRALYERAKQKNWLVWRFIFEAIRGGVFVLWSAAAGIYFALLLFPLRGDEEHVAGRALALIVIWSVTVVVARVAVRLVGMYSESREHIPKTASLFTTITAAGIYAIGASVAMQFLGISIAPVLTALGVGGLAVALALRDTLANFFSGVQIIASGRLRLGDFVRLESGREGFVSDITWLHTMIRERTNTLIVVPNEKLASVAFTNLSLPSEQTLVEANVSIAYGNDLTLVEEQTLEVAAGIAQEFAPRAPAPTARFTNSSETGLTLTVFLHLARYWDEIRARHELYKRLFERYEQQGIVLARQPWAVKTVEEDAIPAVAVAPHPSSSYSHPKEC